MKKVLALTLSVLMVAMMAAGCNSAPAASSAAPAPTPAPGSAAPAPSSTVPAAAPTKVKVAYMPNYGSLWAVTTAIDKGYFKEENIEIELVEFADGPTIIAAMESGSIDVGYIGQGAHKLCVTGRASIFALSHISNGDALIGAKGITKVEDLKGKKVAYSSGSSSEDILVNSLKKANMTMEDITAVDMDAAAIVTAMLSGGVDACAT